MQGLYAGGERCQGSDGIEPQFAPDQGLPDRFHAAPPYTGFMDRESEAAERPWAPNERYMQMALQQARRAADEGEVPVGAVIVHEHQLIGKAYNQMELLKDPTAHAEILAITQAASALGDWRLENTVLYVTKEPCPMCAGAIVQARIPVVVWGLTDSQRGGAVSLFNQFDNPALNHRVHYVPGFLEEEARSMFQHFFKLRRAENKQRDN